jgi:hypothetical protein
MNSKLDLNTLILLLILITLVACGIFLIVSVQKLTHPLEEAEQALQERLTEFSKPTPTIVVDPVTIIRQVRSLSRLETASYAVEKVITAESRQGPFAFLFGDKLILVAHGQVVAGVDLGKMTENDVSITNEGKVFVTLPLAEILIVKLDNQKSYILDRNTGLIGMNPALETEARQAAEEEIQNAALEGGVLDMAQQNAETYVRGVILTLGFQEVVFTHATPIPVPTATPSP